MRTEELLALGMFGRGARIGERIEMLLARGREFSTRASRVNLALSGFAMLACMALGALAPRVVAFAQSRPAFEVASVKAVPPEAHAESRLDVTGGNLAMERQSLKELIRWAYDVEVWRIEGPAWIDSQEFDIRAKAAGSVGQDQIKAMLQTLLEGRFKLALHREQRIVPVYSLVVGKDGPKMHEVQEEARDGGRMGWTDGAFMFDMVNHVSRLAGILPDFLDDRPVQDRTGLTGVYEIPLHVSLDPEQLKRVPQPERSSRDLDTAPGCSTRWKNWD